MARNHDPEQRALPAGAQAPAAGRRLQFPLLGRGPHDLRKGGARAPASPTSTTTSTSTTAWATGRRSSATPTRASTRRPARAWRSAACSRSPPSANTRSPSASRRWCRRPSWCAFPTPAPRRSWRRCGWRAPTPARTTTSSSRAATTGCSTRPCGTRRWRSGPQVGDPQVHPYSEGVPLGHAQLRAFRAGERCQPARGRASSATADSIACLLIEPIMGNCLRHRRRARLPARRARAVRPLRRRA